MKTFYTLSAAAGLIRSNKFLEKADAVAIGSFRAEQRNMPIKIYEHKDTPADKKCILVCNPDGSVGKPKGVGYAMVDADHHSMVPNSDHAHVLLMAQTENAEMPMTALYLKSPIEEYAVAQMEHELDVAIGLYDDRVLHCYTEDADKIKQIEAHLTNSSVEVDRVTKHIIKASEGKTIVESVARKAAMRARAANLPEISARASVRAGRNLRVQCACELFEGTEKRPPMIHVYGDGRKLGECKSDREAGRLMSEYSHETFGKWLKKEIA